MTETPEPLPAPPPQHSARWGGWGGAALVLMLIAVILRLHGLMGGLPAINDPDELTFQLGALRMLRTGTLNPGWFGHPAAITMDVLAIVDVAVFLFGHGLGWFASVKAFGDAIYADPTWVFLPSRLAMAAFSLGCVWTAGRLAGRQWGAGAGLVAGGLLAASPVFIGWSQVIRSDIVACFFMLLALDASHRITAGGTRRDRILLALWTACAVLSKWPFAVVGLAGVGALLLDAATRRVPPAAIVRALAGYGLLTLVFVVCISPYLVLDFQTALRNILGEAQPHHLGSTGGTPLWNLGWYLSGPIPEGLGAAGCLLALAGLGTLHRDRAALAILLPPLLGFVALLLAQNLVWERWALPLIVLLALLAARGAHGLGEILGRRASPRAVTLAAAALLVTAVAPLVLQSWQQGTARGNETRQRATAWAAANVPAGSHILVEHFGFDLLAHPWQFAFPLGNLGCTDARAMLGGKIANSTVDSARGGRSIIDYGTVLPARAETCRADFAILSNYDRYAAERDRFPQEYAMYRRLLAQGRVVATIVPEPGVSAGPVVRIVAFDRQAVMPAPSTSSYD